MRKTWSAAALAAAALAAVTLAASSPSLAADIRVPADQPTILDAMVAAQAGDRVLVLAGTYYENVTLRSDVELRGGYDGTYSDGNRDPVVNRTMIHGNNVGAAITANNVGSGTIVDGFVLRGGGGIPGAGVVVNGGSPTFSNNEISENRRAGIAGGVYIYGGSAARFVDNDVTDNSSGGSGGGFHIENSTPILVGNLIANNAAPHGGGALYAYNSALLCSTTVMQDNRAGESGGGAIRLQECSAGAWFVGCDFVRCTAPYGGGVMIKDESEITLDDCDFIDCTAAPFGASQEQLGGGLAVFPYCQSTLLNCRFDNCSVIGTTNTAYGGAIYVELADVVFQGADASETASLAAIKNCGTDWDGGGVYGVNATGEISRVRFSDCTAANVGGGIHLWDSALVIQENVLESCSAPDGGAMSFYSEISVPPLSNVSNNTMYGCSASGDDRPGDPGPGGVILHKGRRNQRMAIIAGNIISHTTDGSCIRCQKSVGGGSSSKPKIACTTVYRDPSNTDDELWATDAPCVSAWNTDAANRIGDPEFCNAFRYRLKECSPDAGALAGGSCADAVAGRLDPGAYIDDDHCVCPFTALEPTSWGRLKAGYR